MKIGKSELRILKKGQSLSSIANCGISMHCHTEHSKEMLSFIPHYAEKIPIISYFWKREDEKYLKKEGTKIDLSTAYWTPPLDVASVYNSEKDQINEAGIEAIVSVTDHDSIDGALQISEIEDINRAPISFEWTVPFDFGFFHLGVHNLPREHAVEITKVLLDYTFVKESQTNERLHELLVLLNEHPGVLIIFNHPIWDIEMAGQAAHKLLLDDFLKIHGHLLHALEINGFRSWSENKAVIELAEACGMPVVTGGDRHGCQPNTVINLTNVSTFEEFAEEVRVYKRSEVALMPAYEQPLHSRQLRSFSEILSLYPGLPESRRRWFDRVFFDMNDGRGLVPLSSHGWKRGGPTWVRASVKFLAHLGSESWQPIFRLVRKAKDRVPEDFTVAQPVVPKTESRDPEIEKASSTLSGAV